MDDDNEEGDKPDASTLPTTDPNVAEPPIIHHRQQPQVSHAETFLNDTYVNPRGQSFAQEGRQSSIGDDRARSLFDDDAPTHARSFANVINESFENAGERSFENSGSQRLFRANRVESSVDDALGTSESAIGYAFESTAVGDDDENRNNEMNTDVEKEAEAEAEWVVTREAEAETEWIETKETEGEEETAGDDRGTHPTGDREEDFRGMEEEIRRMSFDVAVSAPPTRHVPAVAAEASSPVCSPPEVTRHRGHPFEEYDGRRLEDKDANVGYSAADKSEVIAGVEDVKNVNQEDVLTAVESNGTSCAVNETEQKSINRDADGGGVGADASIRQDEVEEAKEASKEGVAAASEAVDAKENKLNDKQTERRRLEDRVSADLSFGNFHRDGGGKNKVWTDDDNIQMIDWRVHCAQATHVYAQREPFDVNLKQNEIVRVLRIYEDGWWMVERMNGNRGLAPQTFLRVVNPEDERLFFDPPKPKKKKPKKKPRAPSPSPPPPVEQAQSPPPIVEPTPPSPPPSPPPPPPPPLVRPPPYIEEDEEEDEAPPTPAEKCSCLHRVRVPVWVPLKWIQNQLEVQETAGYFEEPTKSNYNANAEEDGHKDGEEKGEARKSNRNANALARKLKTALSSTRPRKCTKRFRKASKTMLTGSK